jgi:hypothetical protein
MLRAKPARDRPSERGSDMARGRTLAAIPAGAIRWLGRRRAPARGTRPCADSPPALYKKYPVPYHQGALKYFADNKIEAKAIR